MRALDVVLADDAAREPMPDLLPGLTRQGVRLERGQVVMVAGPPGGGKSLLGLHYAVHSRVPSLYLSADTDEVTMALRAVAMVTGMRVDDARAELHSGGGDHLSAELWGLRHHLLLEFTPSPTWEDIDGRVRAFVSAFGEAPHLIVVDSLYNVAVDNDSEWTGLRRAMGSFHTLARVSGALVMVLHHVSTNRVEPGLPGGLSSIQGQVSQHAETILTVAADHRSWSLNVATVKNRHGFADATGETVVTAMVDFDRMQIVDGAV